MRGCTQVDRGTELRVNSQDIISKETQASTRNILTASSSVLVVQFFNYNSKDWDILGRNIAPSEFALIAGVVVAFLLVNHLIKWSADLYLYTKWFSLNQVPAGGMEEIGKIGSTFGPIKGLSQRLKWLLSDLDRLVEEEGKGRRPTEMAQQLLSENTEKALSEISKLSESVDRVGRALEEADKLLSQLDKRFEKTDRVVKFIVFGWYGALPILMGFSAVLSLFCV